MARSSSFRLLKFGTYLNVNCNYLDARLSLNKISVRYLRGSRFSKDQTQDELKYQRLLRTLKYGSKSGQPTASSSKSISTDQDLHKNASEESCEDDPKTEISRITPEDIVRQFEQKMVPLKEVTYNRQLQKKFRRSAGILKILGRKLKEYNVPIEMGHDRLPCPVDLVVPSPVTEAYRNQDDFSIGLGLDGNEKTVGFFLDPPTEFSKPFCISAKYISVLKECHKKFAEDFENYIRQSPLPASQLYSDQGFWRNLMVRSSVTGDVMGIIGINPQELTEEDLQVEKEKLKDYFSCISESGYNLHSLYFRTSSLINSRNEESPFDLIMGEPFIIEEASNMLFHISPDSFFYQNTKAAEAMLSALLKLCRVNKSTTVVDLFCGVGPVSLMFSSRAKKCIGIDDSMQAIIDAKLNAVENRVQNAEFLYGRPEVVIRDVLNDFHEDVIVILNCSRNIPNKSLLCTLREFKNLNKIIFISNKPQSVMEHYLQLCRPLRPITHLGKAFLPILALPFDISPHTEHFGLIVMFQRL